MKRVHAVLISILALLAVSLGIATALQSTADSGGSSATFRAASDAAIAEETQRLDAIQRSLETTGRETPTPVPSLDIADHSGAAADANAVRHATRSDHSDDHPSDHDRHHSDAHEDDD